MHTFASVNWIAVLVAALSGFVLGSLWYGALLFQKPWMRLTGITKEQGSKANIPLTFGGAYVLNFIGATGIALLLEGSGGWHAGLHIGAFTGLFFIATALGVIYLFEMRPFQLWLINAGYQVFNFAAMGAVLGAWPT
jgi:hypothetical protein